MMRTLYAHDPASEVHVVRVQLLVQVSVSDLYFIAHGLGVMRSTLGVATKFDATHVTLGRETRVPADVVIKAIGFRISEGNERVLGRSTVLGGGCVARGVFAVVEAHPDGNFSNSAFGSYLDTLDFRCQMMMRFWRDCGLYGSVLKMLRDGPTARINHINGSQEGRGIAIMLKHDPELWHVIRKHTETVFVACQAAWSPIQFLEHNRFAWVHCHQWLRLNGAALKEPLPYVPEKTMSVVQREKPQLFINVGCRQKQLKATGVGEAQNHAAETSTTVVNSTLLVTERRAKQESMQLEVLRVVREITSASDSAITLETPLLEAGLDSLAATEMSSRLRELQGIALSPTIVFEHPTSRELAAHLVAVKMPTAPTHCGEAECQSVITLTNFHKSSNVRITSAVGQSAGGCTDSAARVKLQDACGDALGGVPTLRWILELVVNFDSLTNMQATCVRHGGFLIGAQRFDSCAFRISPAEAATMDPQQRLLLEYGYIALHMSSHRRSALKGGNGGVFLGIERPDWAMAMPKVLRSSVFAVTSDNLSIAAARASFVFDLLGPCMSIDAACAA